VSTVRFLGVNVQEHLSWKPHMEYLLVVKKVSPFLNSKALTMLYYFMIQSHLSYCICTWYNGNNTAKINLQRTANKFIRMIYNLNSGTSVKEIMKENGLPIIDDLENLETACFMQKYENGSLPPAFLYFFEANRTNSRKNMFNKNSPRQTRSQSNLFPSYCRINVTKQSMKYKGPLVWNKIPSNTKQMKNYNKFREGMKNYLLRTTVKR